jgi:hypothetical protein
LTRAEWYPWVLAAGGLLALLVPTGRGPYPVSMVNVPGADLQNTSPPSASLLALAALQTGAALILRRPLSAWLERSNPWAVVVRLNAAVLTLFLWHLSAVVVVAATLYPRGSDAAAGDRNGPLVRT